MCSTPSGWLKPSEGGLTPNMWQIALSASLKRTHAASSVMRTTMSSNHNKLQDSLEKLETIVANMTEFVIFLGWMQADALMSLWCLYRQFHIQSQELINTLLQDNSPVGAHVAIWDHSRDCASHWRIQGDTIQKKNPRSWGRSSWRRWSAEDLLPSLRSTQCASPLRLSLGQYQWKFHWHRYLD